MTRGFSYSYNPNQRVSEQGARHLYGGRTEDDKSAEMENVPSIWGRWNVATDARDPGKGLRKTHCDNQTAAGAVSSPAGRKKSIGAIIRLRRGEKDSRGSRTKKKKCDYLASSKGNGRKNRRPRFDGKTGVQQ